MASPITVGTTAIVAVGRKRRRAGLRIQNTGTTTIYIKKIPRRGTFAVVSPTNYDVLLLPSSATAEGGEPFQTNSISAFQVIGSAAGGALSIYETFNI